MKRVASVLAVVLASVLTGTGAWAENPEDAVYAEHRSAGRKAWTPIEFGFISSEKVPAVYGVEVAPIVSKRERIAGVQVGGIGALASEDVWGFQLAGFGAGAHDLTGLQAAPFFAGSDSLCGLALGGCAVEVCYAAKGVQIGGLSATVRRGGATGLQLAGFWSDCQTFDGLQVAGVMNTVSGDGAGLQLAAFGNDVRGDFSGVQIAGLGNGVGGTFNGLQIGLVNQAAKGTFLQLGLFNFGVVRNGDADEKSFFPLVRIHY